MIILGVDPGTLVTGFGVIEMQGVSKKLSLVSYGTIQSKNSDSLPIRLEAIYKGLAQVIEEDKPDEFAIESAFYDKNVQSTLKLGHARGVAILAAVLMQIPTSEYSPREVKRAVVGNGNASKQQVEYMVRTILDLQEEDGRKLPDAYDALAIAITHAYRLGKSGTKAFRNWKQFIEANPERVSSPTTAKSAKTSSAKKKSK